MIPRIIITCISLIVLLAGMGCTIRYAVNGIDHDADMVSLIIDHDCYVHCSYGRAMDNLIYKMPDDIRLAFDPNDYDAWETYWTRPHTVVVPHDAAVNVALHKPVTSSDLYPIIGELSLVTDGEKILTDDRFVELAWEQQWIQIDLEAEHEIFAIGIWQYYYDARIYRGVIVQVSNDPDFEHPVVNVFNNDRQNLAGQGKGRDFHYFTAHRGKLIKVDAARGRYVRIWSNGSTEDDQNHYVEVEVYGRSPQ